MLIDYKDVTKSVFRLFFTAVTFGLMALVLSACQSKSDIDINSYVEDIDPADALYNQGLANLRSGKLSEAGNKFKALDRQHPYSEYARKGMVMSAFVFYKQGNYAEAVNTSYRYINLYPNTEDAGYAQYIVGLAYFKQIPVVTRDQKTAKKAISAFNLVITRYPDSEYVEDSKRKMRIARDQLAGKEMQVGRYYLERREYLASIKRFRNVTERYPNTRQIEEALARLVEANYALGLTREAQAAAAVLGHNFPDSRWYADSYKLLQSGGLEPRENKKSWLAQASEAISGS